MISVYGLHSFVITIVLKICLLIDYIFMDVRNLIKCVICVYKQVETHLYNAFIIVSIEINYIFRCYIIETLSNKQYIWGEGKGYPFF